MKKIFLSAIMAIAFLMGANAQTVITNDYGSPIRGADGQSVTNDDEEETLGIVNLVYYGFDGFKNYGLSDYFLNPNGFGVDFNIRMNFEKYGNYNVDLGPNYTFKLWSSDNMKLLLTASVGPSFRMQDVPEFSYDNRGNVKEESSTKYKFDMYANARLALNVSRFTVSAGYFLWAAEFKFSEGYKSDGFNVALGYSF